jgi:hypothetical protein
MAANAGVGYKSMTTEGAISALERKVAASREVDLGSGRSILRALRLALARAAKDLFELPLAVIGAKQARCDAEGAGAYLADDRLLVLLDGGDGLAGAVSLDGACVAALIQQQTMGRVTGITMGERPFTGTDAALAEPLIEALLTRASGLTDQPEDKNCLSGFRFGARVEDARSLVLALEADKYRIFDLTIDIAEGTMQGAICLLLPDLPPEPEKGAKNGKGSPPPGPGLDRAFGVMRADLTATICRLRMPLTELAALKLGDVLPLVRERLEETELIAIDGRSIAAGRLGQINGLRALRLNETKAATDYSDLPAPDGFAARVVEPETLGDDAITLDGSIVAENSENLTKSALPALIGEGDSLALYDEPAEPGEDTGNLLDRMTPEEAVAEISQLAGLNAE